MELQEGLPPDMDPDQREMQYNYEFLKLEIEEKKSDLRTEKRFMEKKRITAEIAKIENEI